MIPMLAWIAKEAPRNQKATYFAVMAAFTNLALSASQLATKYLSRLFVVERGRYDELGVLMIVTMAIGLVLPVLRRYGRFSKAYKAGVQQGDLILEVNRQNVSSTGELKLLLAKYKNGDSVSLLVQRSNAGMMVLKMV